MWRILAVTSLVGGLLILPGWLRVNVLRHQSRWLLVLPGFGAMVWLALLVASPGPQGRGSVGEAVAVAVLAVAVAYTKLLVLDRVQRLRGHGTMMAFTAVALAALVLRVAFYAAGP